MVFLFYHLAAAPTEITKLRTELQALTSFSDNRQLTSMAHLNGVINETLRLHPPIPSGGLRDTPPEGLEIDGTYIPGGVTVLLPAYSLGRCTFLFFSVCLSEPTREFRFFFQVFFNGGWILACLLACFADVVCNEQ